MDDTSPELATIQVRIWREKSFEQRMKIGAQADAMGLDAARQLAERRSPCDPAALFLSLHGSSFAADESRQIADAIRRYHKARHDA